MPGRTRHRLVLTDRGIGHRHRHLPSCPCGWIGVPRRRPDEAEAQYRQHRSGGRRHGGPAARALTPVDRLPAALQ